jgi:hypothetical protein
MGEPLAALAATLCVVIVVLVAVTATIGYRARRRRFERMRLWAERNGWTFTPHPDVDWGRHLPGGNKHGVGPTFSCILHGRPVNVAEYSVTDASDGTTTNTHHHVVTVTQLTRPVPPTRVEPRSRTSRLKNTLLGPDETATGDPDFDRAFRIRTHDPVDLRQRFSAPLITAHLNAQVPQSWTVQHKQLLHHRPGRLILDQIPSDAAAALRLADLLDGHTTSSENHVIG